MTKLFHGEFTSGHIEEDFADFLNAEAREGYAFKWAMRTSDGVYVVIFERIS